ncbi:MAG: pyridoxal phosphate-dependent aminotransferase [Candidatus Buchananbacteria bacterium]|nr:pyridoxal phosphate-dependent aminotransferase [Candidatus Buchananbacteria bacterium]
MQPILSKRSSRVLASPIRKFLPLVRQAEHQGVEVIKLNVGDPDILPPAAFLQTVKQYRSKNLGYAPSPGIIEHNQAWVKYYKNFNLHLKPENIIPTVGCAEAMLLAMIAAADPGEEILVFEPLYTSYKGLAASLNIKLVPVTLTLDNNFTLPRRSEIIKKISKKTKAILIVNPANPSGKVLTIPELKMIGEIATKYNLLVLGDETYREIVFDTKPSSLLTMTKIRNRLIVLDSASKRFSLPGARIGCLVSYNQEIMATLLRLAMIRLSAPTLEQLGLIPLLNNAKGYTRKITSEYRTRRNVLTKSLLQIPGVACHKPQGAFYLIARLPVKNSEDFIKFLITDFRHHNQTVMLTPAKEFYLTPGHGTNEVRIAYVLNSTKLKRAATIIGEALKKYQTKP